jgi:hypothetical protein
MIYYTHDRKMGAPHYVWIDVSSDDYAAGMIYYTRYKRMASPHYV